MLVINRLKENPVTRAYLELLGTAEASVLVLRLTLEDKGVGTCVIMALGRNRFTEEHRNLVALLNEPFSVALSNCLRYREVVLLKERLADDYRYLQREMRLLGGSEVIGVNSGLRQVMKMARQVAPLDSPVLLLGETGSGKDVIANAIHTMSRRKEEPFIKVNCGAIPETLVDTELFGYEKGAFTGAQGTRRGRFERASGMQVRRQGWMKVRMSR